MEEPAGIVSFDGTLSDEEMAEVKACWREVHGGGRGRAHVIEPIKLDGESDG